MVTSGQSVPLPSHIHYELLLQLLEQQTMATVYQSPQLRRQTQELIITLRKALSQQRQIEETCKLSNVAVEYQWSTNQPLERFSAEM
ncbi:hypothetical protein GFS31_24420 [Leptolyngbya sp. BL0902]|uniref:DUF5340 family protein n=1 Tax=Leptolyngbya sp. BL0902 TaxID=1115757 RepID=UPI0018E845F7|nr:DUF5340 family protein [Leptolyngbya sp. BL0902]QQE65753.1 hypothetical protein GFS31_24420 [Leptolyngbya sp. BL0902]